MKPHRHFLTIVSILIVAAANAADKPASPQPPAFVLSIAAYSDTLGTRPEWVLILGRTAYRSLDALKVGITHFPKGATVTWEVPDVRIGGEPLTTDAEMKDFKAHCESQGIRFIVIPGG